LLVAVPAEAHLWSFREALFGQVRAHVPLQRMQMLDDDFELVQQQRITQTLQLTAADVSQLMAMTPYAWKAHPEQHHALAQRDQLITEAAFVLSLYRKRY
jgi:23S rRNA (guanine745-N1)-methyltransferase